MSQDTPDIEPFLKELERTEGSAHTIRNYRHLAALRKFWHWAQSKRLIKELPTEQIKGVRATRSSPASLAKREVDKLIRAVERSGKKRDLAIVMLLRHTGIRVGELAALRLSDLKLGERSGEMVVRWGKGGKYRQL